MKKLNLVYGDGFPLDQEVLEFMQTGYSEAIAGLGSFLGGNVVLSGCEIVGSVITNGIVLYNGEVMPFVGGTFTVPTTIGYTTIADAESVTYQDGNVHPVLRKWFLSFTTDNTAPNFVADFKRLVPFSELKPRIEALEAKPFSILHSGSVQFTDVPTDGISGYAVDFGKTLNTDNYNVFGTFRSAGTLSNNANNLTYSTFTHRTFNFLLNIRESFAKSETPFYFDYICVSRV